ncbi:unnamed protein product [Spirodela intermedia]|uniref:Uncharacterized protein n=1 Tax=Spirodela intermedia TaxID=51605 RepID=A0A7I8L305_SPIIN|nr:unnamed protein product [Spirodela intermedia]
MTSAPPLMNLETLWTTTSAPILAGEMTMGEKVLSTTTITPFSCATAHRLGTSATASVGSPISTKVVWIPHALDRNIILLDSSKIPSDLCPGDPIHGRLESSEEKMQISGGTCRLSVNGGGWIFSIHSRITDIILYLI